MTTSQEEVIIVPAATEKDIEQANYCVSEAFGRQVKDAAWILMNPDWDSEAGRARRSQMMIKQWKSTTNDKAGRPNAIYLTASVPDPSNPEERRVAGLAIWKQLSLVEGHGIAFTGDISEALKNHDEQKQRFGTQLFRSLWKRRIEYLHEVSASGRDPPAIFVLDMCAVDPVFQRRGIAAKLVQWGLEEAKRRGNLECTTEGSAMGRGVYRKLGFKDEGVGDIKWDDMDEEFQDWDKPPNVFLRTGV